MSASEELKELSVAQEVGVGVEGEPESQGGGWGMGLGLYGSSQGLGFHPVIKVCCCFFFISSFKQGSGLHFRTIPRKITDHSVEGGFERPGEAGSWEVMVA